MKHLYFAFSICFLATAVLKAGLQDWSFKNTANLNAHLEKNGFAINGDDFDDVNSNHFVVEKGQGIMDAPVPSLPIDSPISLETMKKLFGGVQLSLNGERCARCLTAKKVLGYAAAIVVGTSEITFHVDYSLSKPSSDELKLEINTSGYNSLIQSGKMVYHFKPCTEKLCGPRFQNRTLLTIERVYAVNKSLLAGQIGDFLADGDRDSFKADIKNFEDVSSTPEYSGSQTTGSVASAN